MVPRDQRNDDALGRSATELHRQGPVPRLPGGLRLEGCVARRLREHRVLRRSARPRRGARPQLLRGPDRRAAERHLRRRRRQRQPQADGWEGHPVPGLGARIQLPALGPAVHTARVHRLVPLPLPRTPRAVLAHGGEQPLRLRHGAAVAAGQLPLDQPRRRRGFGGRDADVFVDAGDGRRLGACGLQHQHRRVGRAARRGGGSRRRDLVDLGRPQPRLLPGDDPDRGPRRQVE